MLVRSSAGARIIIYSIRRRVRSSVTSEPKFNNSIANVLCLIVGLYEMCEVVEISDDDECLQFCASQVSSSIEECSQSSHNVLISTCSDLNSAPEEICPVDRKKVV